MCQFRILDNSIDKLWQSQLQQVTEEEELIDENLLCFVLGAINYSSYLITVKFIAETVYNVRQNITCRQHKISIRSVLLLSTHDNL